LPRGYLCAGSKTTLAPRGAPTLRHPLKLFVLIALISIGAPAARSQGARGAGPDARGVPAGAIRIGASATWARSIEAWFDGALLPLGSRFTVDTLGAAQVPTLGLSTQPTLAASGLAAFNPSLGAPAVRVRRAYETTPISVEYGLTSRLTIGALAPFVTSIARVDATISPATANMGINPALALPAVATANGTLVSQIEAATTFVNGRITTCTANPSATGCAGFNPATARTLATEAAAYSAAMATLFGRSAAAVGRPFVPTAGSAALTAIASRLADFKARFADVGAPQITAAAPQGSAPMTVTELQGVLTDSAFGMNARPLESVVRRGRGDLEVHAHFTWHDSYRGAAQPGDTFWWRSAVVGTYRFGSLAPRDDDALVPVPVGAGRSQAAIRVIADLGRGARWSMGTALGFTTKRSEESAGEVALTLAPRWAYSDAMSLAGVYEYRAIPSSRSAVAAPGFSRYYLPGGEAGTAHRLGASLAYSTLAAHDEGIARWPLDIAVTHYQTISGSGSFVQKTSYDAVSVRWYWRR
jgi:hypothetical protein